MDIKSFLNSRQPRWERLTALLDRIEAKGLENLSPHEVDEFYALYRLVSADLNLVQTRTGNPTVLEYLEGLVGRAYAHLAPPSRFRPFRAWARVVRRGFPEAVRAEAFLVALAAAVMLAGAAVGFLGTVISPAAAEAILPPQHLTERPSERVARLERDAWGGRERIDSTQKHALFSSFLFTHNVRVSVLAFALGLTFGVGTLVLLFYNGTVLGSITALYVADGVSGFFIAWVGPHGAVELPCIVLGGAAGLMLARAQFRREAGSLGAQLRAVRPRLVDLIIGIASFLAVAGLIEGGFSQLTQPTVPRWLKIGVAVALFGGFMYYLFGMPTRKRGETAAPGSEVGSLRSSAAS